MLTCPKCYGPLVAEPGTRPVDVGCRSCARTVTLQVFPALYRPDHAAPAASRVAIEGEAACFYCPGKAATIACEGCGSYLCNDCSADWFGKKLCLSCIHSNREVRGATEFKPRTQLYDNIALGMLFLPLVIPLYGLFIVPMAAPFALYFVIRHRKASRGLVPRGTFRLWLAGILSTLILLSLCGVIGYGINRARRFSDGLKTFSELRAAREAASGDAAGNDEDEPAPPPDEVPTTAPRRRIVLPHPGEPNPP